MQAFATFALFTTYLIQRNIILVSLNLIYKIGRPICAMYQPTCICICVGDERRDTFYKFTSHITSAVSKQSQLQ